jgi:hypothetical protein
MVIEQLLSDERLRARFALDRIETIAELCLSGFDLTPDEVELFCRTEVRRWLVLDHTGQWRH